MNWIRQDLDQVEAESKAGKASRIGVGLASIYLAASGWVRADDSRIEAAMAQILSRGGAAADQARAICKAELQPLVKRASSLSTNWETIGVFLTILAGSPLYFLGFQATILNLVMAVCVFAQGRAYARILPRLQALSPS